MLYIPPGLPHWGVADDLCLTYSIGFRAPTAGELRATASRIFDHAGGWSDADIFYADPDLQAAEADDSRISQRTIERIRQQGLLEDSFSDRDLARIFGMTVTDPKAWLDPDPVSTALPIDAASRNTRCRVHGMALLAWFRGERGLIFFLNGRERHLAPAWEPLIRILCRSYAWGTDELRAALALSDGRKQLAWLCENGLFDANEAPE